jgi:hypothetical protein
LPLSLDVCLSMCVSTPSLKFLLQNFEGISFYPIMCTILFSGRWTSFPWVMA